VRPVALIVRVPAPAKRRTRPVWHTRPRVCRDHANSSACHPEREPALSVVEGAHARVEGPLRFSRMNERCANLQSAIFNRPISQLLILSAIFSWWKTNLPLTTGSRTRA
jgi:hypothetical protein